jgi:hypothetical protein
MPHNTGLVAGVGRYLQAIHAIITGPKKDAIVHHGWGAFDMPVRRGRPQDLTWIVGQINAHQPAGTHVVESLADVQSSVADDGRRKSSSIAVRPACPIQLAADRVQGEDATLIPARSHDEDLASHDGR